MVLKLTCTVAVVLGVAVGASREVRAQCASWACNGSNMEWASSANPARVVLNTTEPTYRNVGVRFAVGGTAYWSMAHVNVGSAEVPIPALEFFNDYTFVRALEFRANGELRARNIFPLTTDMHSLGTPHVGVWRTLYVVNPVAGTSDGRLKTEVSTLRYGLDEVSRLRPVTFKWKAAGDDDTHIGLIAQEVEQVIPELVGRGKADEHLSMNYPALIPVLITAIQEQQKTIDGQVARIAKLEARPSKSVVFPSTTKYGAGLFLLALPGLALTACLRRRRSVPK